MFQTNMPPNNLFQRKISETLPPPPPEYQMVRPWATIFVCLMPNYEVRLGQSKSP